MKKQVVACRICGSPAEIFNAKADEAYIWLQCTGCEGIFMREYQVEDASCAVCKSAAKVFKAAKNCLWLKCGNCGGIFKREYQLVEPEAILAE